MDVSTAYPATTVTNRQTVSPSSHSGRQEKAPIVQFSGNTEVVAISDRGKYLSAEAAAQWKDPLDFLSSSEMELYTHLNQIGEEGAAETIRSIGAVRTGQMIGHPVTNADQGPITAEGINNYWSELLGVSKEAREGLQSLFNFIR
ncbi:MAG: hypothetical protein COA42_16670 [Alteromonadaceae bacterium]|nr:MAG: hypothetical protein COA42_16670 [Alteromonadaceae bacterium]